MSRVKVNSINPFTGQNINFGGHAIPSGSSKNLGSETQAWAELYVSTGSVNFVAPITLGQPTVVVATLRAGGEGNTAGVARGQIFTETNNNLRGSFSVGRNNQASGTASLANGSYNTASGLWSHAEGTVTLALGDISHAEGYLTTASGYGAHAEGYLTTASGSYSHAEGQETRALGLLSHAEGQETIALGFSSHAEGGSTKASGDSSHAEGYLTIASGLYSHAEGAYTTASGQSSHAEGAYTLASGDTSHAGGIGTIASGSGQTVVGKYNTPTDNPNSVFIVGTGLNNSSRLNGFSVETDGTKPHIVLPTNTSNPSSPKTGSMYFNPITNLMFIYNGTAWRSASFS